MLIQFSLKQTKMHILPFKKYYIYLYCLMDMPTPMGEQSYKTGHIDGVVL